LTPHVYSIEIVAPIAERAAASLTAQGYGGVHLRIGDGYAGWPEEAPFDAIVLTAAPESLPEPLWQQLAPGGRLVVPLGPVDGVQQLQVLEKGPEGQRRTRTIMGVRFVPMTGAAQGVVAPPPNR
jgi:protein-L-isoaspartate(D-aspartate) O-methyltransferase